MIKSKSLVILSCVLIVFTMVFTVSCGKDGSVRKYKEKGAVAPAKAKATSPHGSMSGKMPGAMGGQTAAASKPHFNWTKPDGWDEAEAKSNFRIATFNVKSGNAEAVCTIIPLSGAAGGLEANVSRWFGQVTGKAGHMDPKLMEGSKADVQKLLANQDKFITKGEFPAVMIDYTPVTAKDEDPSILVTMVTVGGSTVFIKMSGPKSILVANKAKFKGLCESFGFDASGHSKDDGHGHDHSKDDGHGHGDAPKTKKSH